MNKRIKTQHIFKHIYNQSKADQLQQYNEVLLSTGNVNHDTADMIIDNGIDNNIKQSSVANHDAADMIIDNGIDNNSLLLNNPASNSEVESRRTDKLSVDASLSISCMTIGLRQGQIQQLLNAIRSCSSNNVPRVVKEVPRGIHIYCIHVKFNRFLVINLAMCSIFSLLRYPQQGTTVVFSAM